MENTPNIELSPKIYKRVEFLMKIFTAIREWIKTAYARKRLKIALEVTCREIVEQIQARQQKRGA